MFVIDTDNKQKRVEIMTFKEWFFGENGTINPGFDNPDINMQWKLPHILVLLTCIATIIAILFRFCNLYTNEK